MKRLNGTILAATMILMPAAGFAEDAHHPGAAQEPTAESSAPAPAPQADAPDGGMMNEGMMRMMMGMMGGGMAGGGQPTAYPMGQMMSPEYVEGRIAFLGTELKVTDAQQPLWQTVAEALRANAATAKDMMPGMADGMMPSKTEPTTPLQRIEIQEKMLSARLDSLRRLKAALEPFYAALDDTQKAVAGKLLVPAPMGMM